jgi:hypothetical protein
MCTQVACREQIISFHGNAKKKKKSHLVKLPVITPLQEKPDLYLLLDSIQPFP